MLALRRDRTTSYTVRYTLEPSVILNAYSTVAEEQPYSMNVWALWGRRPPHETPLQDAHSIDKRRLARSILPIQGKNIRGARSRSPHIDGAFLDILEIGQRNAAQPYGPTTHSFSNKQLLGILFPNRYFIYRFIYCKCCFYLNDKLQLGFIAVHLFQCKGDCGRQFGSDSYAASSR